jgi:hypothetical protein
VGPEDFVVGADAFGGPSLNNRLVDALRVGPLPGRTDVEAAMGLAQLVDDELTANGTGGGGQLPADRDMAAMLVALRAALRRLGVESAVPFRNYATFKTHWISVGASGSWQARRDLVRDLFDPIHQTLLVMETRHHESVADPISPRGYTGWARVDDEIRELRKRFAIASTTQDYRAIGTHCVGVLEALSAEVYDPVQHLPAGEKEPPVDQTKTRLGAYISADLGGKRNEDVRGVAVKAVALAHHVKHSNTSTRRDAGIAADAVVLLAHILRRLTETP